MKPILIAKPNPHQRQPHIVSQSTGLNSQGTPTAKGQVVAISNPHARKPN